MAQKIHHLLPSNRQPFLPAMLLAKTPRLARRLWRLVLVALLVLPFVLLLVPWTQTVHGSGRAIAFNPVQRPQFIVSPIEGRIKKWYVVEGDRVAAGQRIVEMVDNDPQLELRLLDEERAILERLRAAENRVRDIEARIRNLQNSRDLAILVQDSILREEDARLLTFKQEEIASRATVEAAEPNYRRQKELFENKLGGLASKRDLELATQTLETALAKLTQARAMVKLGEARVDAAQKQLKKVEADTAAMINLETASQRTAEAEVASVQGSYAQIQVRIARQRAQYVDAPADGTVFRLLANAEQGGILVKPGERLAVLVPDIKETKAASSPDVRQLTLALGQSWGMSGWLSSTWSGPIASGLALHHLGGKSPLTTASHPGIVVELQIDGNDLPLVHKGDKVRLQFEGWPAAQFVGWPSVAVGTFGGQVYLVDPTANDKGQFRILVEPDPQDEPWPDQQYLRQGVRGQGWVLLNRVTLGWELWRHLNGFPATRDGPAKK